MNDLDNFGFGNIGPEILETENQQEEEPEQESNTSTQQNTAATIHQLATIEWKKQLEMFKDCNNNKTKSLCKGRDSLLISYTDTLLSFIIELRETGMPVSTTMVLMKAAQVCHDFHEKTREAQVSTQNGLSRFTGWCTELVPIYPNEHQERCRGHWTSS